MSVRDSYNKRVTFDIQEGLENKIDKLTAMVDKLVARDYKVIGHSNLKYIKVNKEEKVELS